MSVVVRLPGAPAWRSRKLSAQNSQAAGRSQIRRGFRHHPQGWRNPLAHAGGQWAPRTHGGSADDRMDAGFQLSRRSPSGAASGAREAQVATCPRSRRPCLHAFSFTAYGFRGDGGRSHAGAGRDALGRQREAGGRGPPERHAQGSRPRIAARSHCKQFDWRLYRRATSKEEGE